MRRKIGITPWAGLVLCASLLLGVTACGDDLEVRRNHVGRRRRDDRRRGRCDDRR